MKYVIEIGQDTKARLQLLRYAFVVGGNNDQSAKKNIETLRREIAVMDLFDAIMTERAGNGEPEFEIKPGASEIVFDRPQYELATAHLNAMVSVTSTAAARRMVDLVDWFSTIQPTDAPKAKSAKRSKAA